MADTAARTRETLAWLRRRGTAASRAGLARYGIVARKVFGVSVADLRTTAKRTGKDHALARALWASGWYEARLLVAFVGEPERLTSVEMDRWAGDFDSWAVCDALCFHLFDKTPLAWKKIAPWARRREEFVRRAAFALLASLALHDRRTPDAPFLKLLPVIERGAVDERNFVKKGVSWALRSLGSRSSALHAAALALAVRLKASTSPAARWVGADTLRDLTRPLVLRRVAARRAGT